MRSQLKIENLELQIYLGWEADELTAPRRVLFNIYFILPKLPNAINTDDLADTLCYAEIEKILTQELTHKKFRLLEHLGYRSYELIKAHVPADIQFKISVTKFLQQARGSRSFELSSE